MSPSFAARAKPAALVSFAVFAATLFHPWWKAVVHHDTYLIQAFAFVLQHNLPFDMGTDFIIETPRPAVIFFLCLFVFYALLVLWGGTMKGNKGRTFVALAGLCMMLYTAGFYGAIWYATDRIDVPVTGFALVIFEVPVDVFMNFERSYFVAIGAGAACLLSSLFHGFPTLRLHRKKGASRNDV